MAESLSAIELMRRLRELHDLHRPGKRPPPMQLPHWLMELLVHECRQAWTTSNIAWPCPFGDPDTLFGIRVARDHTYDAWLEFEAEHEKAKQSRG